MRQYLKMLNKECNLLKSDFLTLERIKHILAHISTLRASAARALLVLVGC